MGLLGRFGRVLLLVELFERVGEHSTAELVEDFGGDLGRLPVGVRGPRA